MVTAKVFHDGGHQANRLPKEFWVSSDAVTLKMTPVWFLVFAKDPWKLFREGIEELSDDFFAGGRNQPPPQKPNSTR